MNKRNPIEISDNIENNPQQNIPKGILKIYKTNYL